jgi:hypothetical protein
MLMNVSDDDNDDIELSVTIQVKKLNSKPYSVRYHTQVMVLSRLEITSEIHTVEHTLGASAVRARYMTGAAVSDDAE